MIYIPNEVVERVIIGKLTPVHAWREYLGLTQSEVARRLDVSRVAYAQWEASETRPRQSTLRHIAQVLGIKLEQLNF